MLYDRSGNSRLQVSNILETVSNSRSVPVPECGLLDLALASWRSWPNSSERPPARSAEPSAPTCCRSPRPGSRCSQPNLQQIDDCVLPQTVEDDPLFAQSLERRFVHQLLPFSPEAVGGLIIFRPRSRMKHDTVVRRNALYPMASPFNIPVGTGRRFASAAIAMALHSSIVAVSAI